MFGLSGEHLLILAGILIIFGPRRLPQAGATLGKAVRNFKEHFNGIQEPEFRRIEERKNAE
ncbi:MAG: twin-arginine translocase TatA/TatE family subunit [Deltaproteobacteria bacterium]|nr:twin-arginine translocase TatA/TatE family subunit [Deltaproteobacteria bacterium]